MSLASPFIVEEDDDDEGRRVSLLMSSTSSRGEEMERGAGSDYARLEDVDEFNHALPIAPTCRDRCCYPFRSIQTYFSRLVHTFGWRFIAFLVVTQLGIKGVLYTLVSSGLLPIFKGLGVDAANLQLYGTIAVAPWALKPLTGAVSDVFPIGGYRKKYWALQAVLVGVLGSSCLVLGYRSGAALLIVCFVSIHYEMSVADLMSEGKYSEIMRDNPKSGSDIITFVHGCQRIGSIVALSFVGPLADARMYTSLFVIATLLSVSPIIPIMLDWLPEKRRSITESGIRGCRCCMFDLSTFQSERGIFIIAAITGLGGPVLAVVTTYANRWIGIATAIVFLAVVIIGSYRAFPVNIANVALFQVITSVSSPSIGSAMDYFYTADEQCVPGGPGFTFEYYITYTGILGAAMTFLAVLLYQVTMSRWRFRTVILVTLIMSRLGGVVDLILVKRWNLEMGIPDKVFYVLGEAILENVVVALYTIPTFAIIGKVCPEGAEAATFAFMAGISNLSGMVSGLMGAVIFEFVGIKTTEPGCDFSSLWILVLVCNILAPLLIGIPNSWLIPQWYQTDQFVKGHAAGTEEEDMVPLESETETEQPSSILQGMTTDDDKEEEEDRGDKVTRYLDARGLWSERT